METGMVKYPCLKAEACPLLTLCGLRRRVKGTFSAKAVEV